MLTKLKIDSSLPVWLIDVPKDIDLGTAAADVQKSLASKQAITQILLFAESRKALDPKLDKILPRLAEKAVFWVAYPKKSGKIQSDLIRDEGWEKIGEHGYRIVSSAAINEDWSAVRISKIDANKVYKSSTPMAERITPGIDYVKRTVVLPADAKKAMKEFKGLEAFFNAMSFSHKKEYVEAIEESKKPETRQRRIDKMIEMVLVLQEKKQK
jgi:hypothetical protein